MWLRCPGEDAVPSRYAGRAAALHNGDRRGRESGRTASYGCRRSRGILGMPDQRGSGWAHGVEPVHAPRRSSSTQLLLPQMTLRLTLCGGIFIPCVEQLSDQCACNDASPLVTAVNVRTRQPDESPECFIMEHKSQQHGHK